MKFGPAILCLAALALFNQQARAESIRWIHPGHEEGGTFEEGDTFEYRVVSVEVAPGWRPLKELYRLGEIRGAVVDPLVSMTVEARTTRDGVTGAVSAPKVYVPEPGMLAGLVVGVVALGMLLRLER